MKKYLLVMIVTRQLNAPYLRMFVLIVVMKKRIAYVSIMFSDLMALLHHLKILDSRVRRIILINSERNDIMLIFLHKKCIKLSRLATGT